MGRQTAEPDHRFGASPPLTIGVEEELLLVDEERRPVAVADYVIDGLDPAARELVSTEIFAAQIELKTGICGGAATAAAELGGLRGAVRATGVGLLGAGIHPDGEIERILAEGNGADRARHAFERGGIGAALDHLAATTAAD